MLQLKKISLFIALLLCLGVLAGCASQMERVPGQPGSETVENLPDKSSSGQEQDPVQNNDSLAALLNQIMQSARQGKVINCEFPVQTTVIETVKEKWGDPDKEDYISAAKGTYATYDNHNVAFGFNKGSQIFDVRSYDKSLKQISMSSVKEILGTPENTHHYDTEDLLVYNLGEEYQLLFIFTKATQQKPDPELNHYNVFYPRGTVNSMAGDPGIKY